MRRKHFTTAAVISLSLGAAAATALWAPGSRDDPPAEPWIDRSPHRQGLVTVNGIRIEYLDWGGSGEPMVLLAGSGLTAHIYDQMAPQFTNDFRVVGLTRRGTGASDKPADGYDLPTMVDDIRQALDALGIRRAVVAGHSFGAQEAAAFAIAFPEHVSRVVYLDGAYEFSHHIIDLNEQVFALTPQPSERESSSFSSLLNWYRDNKPGWNVACEADFRATRITSANGVSIGASTRDVLFAGLLDSAITSPPDFSKVTAPALAVFADHRFEGLLNSLERSGNTKGAPLVREALHLQRQQIERFRERVKDAKVVELADTDHMCFTQREQEVVDVMRSFLNSSASGSGSTP
jgi:non-heme chloroperoxidase